MAFIITKDIIDDGNLVDSWNSMRDMDITECKRLCKHKFRLLDDDDEVYFEGLSSDDSSFFALDAVGLAYGCTSIEYWNKNTKKWEVL